MSCCEGGRFLVAGSGPWLGFVDGTESRVVRVAAVMLLGMTVAEGVRNDKGGRRPVALFRTRLLC